MSTQMPTQTTLPLPELPVPSDEYRDLLRHPPLSWRLSRDTHERDANLFVSPLHNGHAENTSLPFTATPFYRLLSESKVLCIEGAELGEWLDQTKIDLANGIVFLVPVGIHTGIQGFHLMAPKPNLEKALLRRLYDLYLFDCGANLMSQMQSSLAEDFNFKRLSSFQNEHLLIEAVAYAICHWIQPTKVSVKQLSNNEELVTYTNRDFAMLKQAPAVDFKLTEGNGYQVRLEFPIFPDAHPDRGDNLADCQFFQIRQKMLTAFLKGEMEALILRYHQSLGPYGQLREIQSVLDREPNSSDVASSPLLNPTAPPAIFEPISKPASTTKTSGVNSITFDRDLNQWNLVFNGRPIIENLAAGNATGLAYIALLIEIWQRSQAEQLAPHIRKISRESYFIFRYGLDGSHKNELQYAGNRPQANSIQTWYASLSPESHQERRNEMQMEAQNLLEKMKEIKDKFKPEPPVAFIDPEDPFDLDEIEKPRHNEYRTRLRKYELIKQLHYHNFLINKITSSSSEEGKLARKLYTDLKKLYNLQFPTQPLDKEENARLNKWAGKEVNKKFIPKDWREGSKLGYAYYLARKENLRNVRDAIEKCITKDIHDPIASEYFKKTIFRFLSQGKDKVLSFYPYAAPEDYRELTWQLDIPTHSAFM